MTETAKQTPPPMGRYPNYRRVGNLIFCSGQGARDPETNRVPGFQINTSGNIIEYEFAQQVHSVMRNVKTVLEEAGSSWDKIIDVTVYLTDLKRDFDVYNKIYAEYFGENPPCRTTLGVESLPSHTCIELKVIATV